jgi:hypothetical protein
VVGLLGADVESHFLEGSEMKIEKTGEYVIRSGHKAVVVSINGDGIQSVVGYMTLDNGKHLPAQWFNNGMYFTNGYECSSDIVAEYTEPNPPQYVPYTADDLPMLRGRWYRIKSDSVESMVIRFSLDGHVFCMNGLPSEFFLNECEWLDGTPCGKVVTE